MTKALESPIPGQLQADMKAMLMKAQNEIGINCLTERDDGKVVFTDLPALFQLFTYAGYQIGRDKDYDIDEVIDQVNLIEVRQIAKTQVLC